MHNFTIKDLKNEIIGNNYFFITPFGKRLLTYADYTASGRNVSFIEKYLLSIQESYANTHTEDDITGKSMTELLHQAETSIKKNMNASENCILISIGTGCTGAIHYFQNLIGVYLSPIGKERMYHIIDNLKNNIPDFRQTEQCTTFIQEFKNQIELTKPVIFIGPYEHHSNEVTWRECLVELVKVNMTPEGEFDLSDLEKKVSDEKYKNRFKVASISACSNVTGIKTPVYEASKICHKHGCIICIDFAASAPYVEIDMNKDDESYFDAVYFSPHKYLGGPGSCGLLLLNKNLYRCDLPPMCGGGGTVDYVGYFNHDYSTDIETRERAGTPGTLQIIKAALAIELKKEIGIDLINSLEHKYITHAMERIKSMPNVIILGNPDPNKRIAILSFIIKHKDRYLHPKLVTRVLNDLFGIQSRAGCSCAGPYAHHLLNISCELSEKFRARIKDGYSGIKPGWTRINFHYSFDEHDVNFLLDAIEYIAKYGHIFIQEYIFDVKTGAWYHPKDVDANEKFDIQNAFRLRKNKIKSNKCVNRKILYKQYIKEATKIKDKLSSKYHESELKLVWEDKDICSFYVHNMVNI